LAPETAIDGVLPLRGGLAAAMDAFVLRGLGGGRRLVLRRYIAWPRKDPAAEAERCWRTLRALQQLRIPAPRPIWLDAAGGVFGAPALVMTRIPGRTDLLGADVHAWIANLAVALARVHMARLGTVDLSFLPEPNTAGAGQLALSPKREAAVREHPLGAATLSALRQAAGPHAPDRAVLTHGDYWAGNTVSSRRRTVIVDWDEAALEQPGFDVGYCRMDLSMLRRPGAPDLFLEAYEQKTGARVANLAFWDLLAALRAMPNPERWLPGYHGLGRDDISAEDMRRGLDGFVRDALRRIVSEHEEGR
jgi:aminoglycoside phosphotransferase (APT) family kinase protein